MSTDSEVKVVTIGPVIPHPNADTLSMTEVDGRIVLFKTGDFQPGDTAAYIPVDTKVPTSHPSFSFLGTKAYHRIRARKLRGVFSMGLLVQVPPGFKEGDSLWDAFGCMRVVDDEQPEREAPSLRNLRAWERNQRARRWLLAGAGLTGVVGFVAWWLMPIAALTLYVCYRRSQPKKLSAGYYDIESLRKHKDLLRGRRVRATEKIHGCHAAYVRLGKKLYCFSRTVLRATDDSNVWGRIALKYGMHRLPEGKILRGEIFGPGIQDLDYSCAEPVFRAFDLQDWKTRKYEEWDVLKDTCAKLVIPVVPVIYEGTYDSVMLKALAEGPTLLGGGRHVREGIVVRAMEGHRDQLKLVGEGYMLRKVEE